jgi:DNA-binding NarL/FixJ family response regulator
LTWPDFAEVIVLENVRIMVVESNHMVNSLIKDVMMFCVNREITSFFKDEDAITYMERSGVVPDLLISRFKDDNVNSEKIVDFIKEKEEDCVFVFTSDVENDRDTAQNNGANAFLPIPFSIGDLFKIVDDYVVAY